MTEPTPIAEAPGWSLRRCRHTGVLLAEMGTHTATRMCELNLSWSTDTLHIRIKNPICNLSLAIPMTVLAALNPEQETK